MVEPYSRFGDNCRPLLISLRLESEWKQQDVADIMHIARSAYAQIEAGIREGTNEQWAALERIFCQPRYLLSMRKPEYFDYLRSIEGA